MTDGLAVRDRVTVSPPRRAHGAVLLLVALLLAGAPLQAAQVDTASWQARLELVASLGYAHGAQQTRLQAARQDYREGHFILAWRQFTALANEGNAEAQFYLGQMFDLGQGVAADPRRAFHWYRAAARQGHLDAQHNLAIAYAEGRGVRSDIHQAVRWWIQSADRGNIDAQYNLGMVYMMGHRDLPPDPTRAMLWWRKAARNGDALAQFNLGTLYANGEGTRTNFCEAVRWWRRSADNGLVEAAQLLSRVKNEAAFARCW